MIKNNNKKNIPQQKISFKKQCKVCQMGLNVIDYKDVELLKRFISYNGKILPARVSGLCCKHQRMIANAIKRARIVALLPFIKD
ncbi:MAG: 30S ribosomal protein S18 [Mycoplasmataceae bacterium]|jgi:small subunit ribosomal protein S18|nr:30S ribosomal protein S18 [Mycoplasmataceae bacterium]